MEQWAHSAASTSNTHTPWPWTPNTHTHTHSVLTLTIEHIFSHLVLTHCSIPATHFLLLHTPSVCSPSLLHVLPALPCACRNQWCRLNGKSLPVHHAIYPYLHTDRTHISSFCHIHSVHMLLYIKGPQLQIQAIHSNKLSFVPLSYCIMENNLALHSKFKCNCLWSTLHSPILQTGRRFRRLHATQ